MDELRGAPMVPCVKGLHRTPYKFVVLPQLGGIQSEDRYYNDRYILKLPEAIVRQINQDKD